MLQSHKTTPPLAKTALWVAMLALSFNQSLALAQTSTDYDAPIEAHVRSYNTAALYIDAKGNWSVGPDVDQLVKVHYGSFAQISDKTFGLDAVAAEKSSNGYLLFLENPNTGDLLQVELDASGLATTYKLMTDAEIYQTETKYSIDLNYNGGIGPNPVLYSEGSAKLYLSGNGKYQVANGKDKPMTITANGIQLSDFTLPANWEIFAAFTSGNEYLVFLADPQDRVFEARLNAKAEFISGRLLSDAEVNDIERQLDADINHNANRPLTPGWENALQDPFIKAELKKIVSSTTGAAQLTHASLTKLLENIIANHSGNQPLSAAEIADLRTLASYGRSLFVAKTIDNSSADYLAYVFDKVVNNSLANNFWTGGATTPSTLGNLSTDSSLDAFKKLVDKWLWGRDLPSPRTIGDSATGAPQQVVGVYQPSNGQLIVNGIDQTDVNQGSLGDCYLVAAVLGAADLNPNQLTAMIVDNGNQTWGVRFFDRQGKAHWVTVNNQLPTNASNPNKLVYGGDLNKATHGEIWWPLLEKAYAQANSLGFFDRDLAEKGKNAYWSIEGGWGEALAYISGYQEVKLAVNDTETNIGAVKTSLLLALQQKQPIWIASFFEGTDVNGKNTWVQGHAFMVLGNSSNSSNLTVRNPWTYGGSTTFANPFTVTLDDLIRTPTLSFRIGQGY